MDEMTLNVTATAVRADGLSRRYGTTRALDEVSLNLERGITGLLGPNGAGYPQHLRDAQQYCQPGRLEAARLDRLDPLGRLPDQPAEDRARHPRAIPEVPDPLALGAGVCRYTSASAGPTAYRDHPAVHIYLHRPFVYLPWTCA
jgi:hypothetical protein